MSKLCIANICQMNKNLILKENIYFSVEQSIEGAEKISLLESPLSNQKKSEISIFEQRKTTKAKKIPFINKIIDLETKKIVPLITLTSFCTETYQNKTIKYYRLYKGKQKQSIVAYIEREGKQKCYS